MARGNATGVSGKLAGKGHEIVQKRDSGVSFATLALAYDCSDVAVRNAYKTHKALQEAQAPAPVKTYFREPEKKDARVGKKAKVGQGGGDVPPALDKRPACFGSTDCPLTDPEACEHFAACLNELKEWAQGADTETPQQAGEAGQYAPPATAAAEGTEQTKGSVDASTVDVGPSSDTDPDEAAAAPAPCSDCIHVPEDCSSCEDAKEPEPVDALPAGYCNCYRQAVTVGNRCLDPGFNILCWAECRVFSPQAPGATNVVQKSEPTPEGFCVEHGMKVVQGERCPNAEAGYRTDCSPECMDWRDNRPIPHEVAEEIAAAVEEQLVDRPEPVKGWCAAGNFAADENMICTPGLHAWCMRGCSEFRTDAQVIEAARERVMADASQHFAEMKGQGERSCDTCQHRGFTCFDFDADELKCGRGLPLWNVGGYGRALADARAKLQPIPSQPEAEGPEPPEAPIPFAGQLPRHLVLDLHTMGLGRLLGELTDPAIAALTRLAEADDTSRYMQRQADIITIAHELGMNRGYAAGLGRAPKDPS